jgi:hypothetical protein
MVEFGLLRRIIASLLTIANTSRCSKGIFLLALMSSLTASGGGPRTSTVLIEYFNEAATDVPGSYPPFSFDPRGLLADPGIDESTPTDSFAEVDSGSARVARGIEGPSNSVPYARPELSIDSIQTFGLSAYPERFRIHVDLGGTPGNESWWGPGVTLGDGVHEDISLGFAPGTCAQNAFRFCISGSCEPPITPSRCWSTGVLYGISIDVLQLQGAVQVDTQIWDPVTSEVFSGSSSLSYPHPVSRISFHRQGHGGGDAVIDNVIVTLPEPELNWALVFSGTGLAGLGLARRTRVASAQSTRLQSRSGTGRSAKGSREPLPKAAI